MSYRSFIRVVTLCVLTATAVVAPSAQAQPKGLEADARLRPRPHRANQTQTAVPTQAPTTSYTFDDEQVRGDVLNPNAEVLLVKPHGQRASLIRARTDFVVALLVSVESL